MTTSSTPPPIDDDPAGSRFVDTDLDGMTISLDKNGTAFVEGYEAFEEGKTPDDNPHEKGTELFTAWRDGFLRAKSDVEAPEPEEDEA